MQFCHEFQISENLLILILIVLYNQISLDSFMMDDQFANFNYLNIDNAKMCEKVLNLHILFPLNRDDN